jgi:Putative adhesin
MADDIERDEDQVKRWQGVMQGEELHIDVSRRERPPEIQVGNLTGAVRVRGVEGQDFVGVRATKSNGDPVPAELIADVDQRADGEITIRARPEGDIQRQVRRLRSSFDFGKQDIWDRINVNEIIDAMSSLKTIGRNLGSAMLEVTVPRACDLTVKTMSGAIAIESITGTVHAHTTSGHVDCAGITGKLTAKSVSGNVRARDISGAAYLQSTSGEVVSLDIDGNLMLKTMSGGAEGRGIAGQVGFKSMSGDLDLRGGQLSGLYCNTTSGRCTIDAVLGPGEYEARTVSGDIDLRPQADLNAELSGRTVSGSFRCALPYRHRDDDWRLDLNADADDDRDDDNEGDDEDDEETMSGGISLPGMHIDDRGISMPGMRIDDEGIDIPGLHLSIHSDREWAREQRHAERERRRERRRGRNRWEYLIGDPAAASARLTRLRVRTVSGSLSIRPRRESDVAMPTGAARPSTPAAPPAGPPARTVAQRPPTPERSWPDSELWPPAEPTTSPPPPEPPTPPDAPAPPAMPAGPEAGAAPAQTATQEDHPAASTEPGADESAANVTQGDEPTSTTAPAAETPASDGPSSAAEPDGEPAAAAEPPNRERTRLEILEAIERKEITPDEALLLLQELDE